MMSMMALIANEYENARPDKHPAEMVEWLREFHSRLAERPHQGEDVLDLIPDWRPCHDRVFGASMPVRHSG